MRSKLPHTNKPAAPQPSAEEQWRSGRARFGWRQMRRGRDKQWHFSGQKEGEVILLVLRKHWIYLVRPALPLLGAIVAELLVAWAAGKFPQAGSFWSILAALLGLVILIALAWFAWSDLAVWWYESYIITEKRIISSRGLLQPVRQETPIEKIQEIGIDIKPPWGFLLSYGTVHLYLVGSDMKLEGIPNPRRARDVIAEITSTYQAGKPPAEKIIPPADIGMAALIDKLAQGKTIDELPDADANYPPPRNPHRYRGPRRTFGGFLHLDCDVRYTSGEYTVMYIQHSRYILYRNLVPFVLALLVLLPLTIYGPTTSVFAPLQSVWWIIMIPLLLLLAFAILLAYTNWADDVYILTNKRVIDIDRRLVIFYETRTETEYKNIRDLKVVIPNLMMRLLDIGHVYIETPGSNPDITLESVDHPMFLIDKVSQIRSFKEKKDEADKIQKEKDELKKWFSEIITKLEQTPQLKGAPNLQNLGILAAMMRASELGLKLVVEREESMHRYGDTRSLTESGIVISQEPPPGTVIEQGGEIRVVLSG